MISPPSASLYVVSEHKRVKNCAHTCLLSAVKIELQRFCASSQHSAPCDATSQSNLLCFHLTLSLDLSTFQTPVRTYFFQRSAKN